MSAFALTLECGKKRKTGAGMSATEAPRIRRYGSGRRKTRPSGSRIGALWRSLYNHGVRAGGTPPREHVPCFGLNDGIDVNDLHRWVRSRFTQELDGGREIPTCLHEGNCLID